MKSMFLALAMLMTSNLAPWAEDFVLVTAAESDCESETDKIPCRAEKGDPMAMYMMGRRTYTSGRESGDMTEALQWARKCSVSA